jgi:hypothetical protein
VIGDWDEQRLEAFVRQRLNLPENLRSKLAAAFLRLTTPADVAFDFGRATIVFTADWNSAGLTVAHDIGRAPTTVIAVAEAYTGTVANINVAVSSITAADFVLSGREVDKTAITQNVFVYWIAVG